MHYTFNYPSPFGDLTIASDGKSLTGAWFYGQKYYARSLAENAENHEEAVLPVFKLASDWLDCYFKGSEPHFDLPLSFQDTPFRLAVWNILKEIPYGSTITYKEIAQELARQRGNTAVACQAIGGAVGHNPISVIVPCHRVVGSDGSLTGYAGGLDLKRKLLLLEKVGLPSLFR